MKRGGIFVFAFLFLISSFYLVSATSYHGDGNYSVVAGDNITLNNGWKIQIESVNLTETPLSPGNPQAGVQTEVSVSLSHWDSSGDFIPGFGGGYSNFSVFVLYKGAKLVVNHQTHILNETQFTYDQVLPGIGSTQVGNNGVRLGKNNTAKILIKLVNFTGSSEVELSVNSINESSLVSQKDYCSSFNFSICSPPQVCLGSPSSNSAFSDNLSVPGTNKFCCLTECAKPGSPKEIQYDIYGGLPLPKTFLVNSVGVKNATCNNSYSGKYNITGSEACILYENGSKYCLSRNYGCLETGGVSVTDSNGKPGKMLSTFYPGGYPTDMNITCPEVQQGGQILCYLHFNESATYGFYCLTSSTKGCPPKNNVNITSCQNIYSHAQEVAYNPNASSNESEFTVSYMGENYGFGVPNYRCQAYVSQNFIQKFFEFIKSLF